MTKRFLISLSLTVLMFSTAFALPRGVDFSINFHNKELYYINTSVFLRASLMNNSDSIFTFRVADKKVFNLGIKVVTLENDPLDPSESFIREKNSNHPVYFREVSLKQGEEFSFIINLDDFVSVKDSGVYSVRADLYPNLAGVGLADDGDSISSNTLIFFVRPETVPFAIANANIQSKVSSFLEKREMSPDEVVVYTLRARQMNEAEKFFLYLDTESLILEDPTYSLAYRTSEQNRLAMINDYRNLLWKSGTMDLGRRSDSFEIVSTSYTPNSGKVIARLAFDEGNFISYKDYTFYLRKKDLYWMIYNYTVQNTNIKTKADS